MTWRSSRIRIRARSGVSEAVAHGYNPYRNHGKFAPGPHQEHQELVNKEGRHRATVAKLGKQMEAVKATAASATPAVKAAHKARFDKLAARQATQRAGAHAAKEQRSALVESGKVKAATSKRKPRAKQEAEPTRNPLTPSKTPPKPSELTKAVGDGGIPSHDGWSIHGLTPEAQRAVRGHFDDVVGAYGLSPRPGAQSHELIGYSTEAMGGAAGWHTGSGKIAVSHEGINSLARYGGQDHEYVGRVLAAGEHHGGFTTYHVMVHETTHDHGPVLAGHDAHRTHVEEMTTEMSARHISAQVHGIEGHQISAGYNEMIDGSVGHVARVAGVSREAAFDALAKASIEFKSSGTHLVDADSAHRMLAWNTLEHLGAASAKQVRLSEQKQRELVDGWQHEARKLTSLSSSLDASGIL